MGAFRKASFGIIVILLGYISFSLIYLFTQSDSEAVAEANTVVPTETLNPTLTSVPTLIPTKRPTFTPTPKVSPSATSTRLPAPTATEVITATASLSASLSDEPETTATDTPTPTATLTPITGVLNDSQVNLRRGPGTEFDVVGQVNTGDVVAVFEQNEAGDWFYITVANETLTPAERIWIYAEFVDLDGAEANQIPVQGQATPTPVTPTPVPVIIALGRVTDDAVNIRSGPSTNTTIIGRADLDQPLQVLGGTADESWWEIINPFDETEIGWITAEFVEITEEISSTSNVEGSLLITSTISSETTFSQTDTITRTDILTQSSNQLRGDEDENEGDEEAEGEDESPADTETEDTSSANNNLVAIANPAGVGLPGLGNYLAPNSTNPLTGLPLPALRQQQRPILTCINNDSQARPPIRH